MTTSTIPAAEESIKELEDTNQRISQFLRDEIQKPLVFEGLMAKLQQIFSMSTNPQIDIPIPKDKLENLKKEAQRDLETINKGQGGK